MQDIRNIQISQGPLRRLTNVGKIGISSTGRSDVEIEVQGVLDPAGVKTIIDKCRSAQQIRKIKSQPSESHHKPQERFYNHENAVAVTCS